MTSAEIIVTNDYQTKITKELLDMYPDWVRDQFMNIVTNIPFVKYMIGTERKRACELPRDEEGKIIIDVTHPHILEDMDYFRQPAIFFEENGCYTILKPNKAKGSEFQKWFQEEKRRCLEGYVRESDGEWVTGYLYWYLNYSPIKLNRQTKKGVWHQVEHLPDFWEAVYYGFHAFNQARLSGKHLIELARRGGSKSYRIASVLNHNLILGEDSESQTDVNSILTAYTKEYLGDKDGTLSKFEIMRTFTAKNTQFKRTMLKASPSEMIWRQGYEDDNKIKHSTNNIVLGISVKDDESKVRGKRGMIFFEEMGCHLRGTKVLMYDHSIRNVEDIHVGDVLMGDDGTPRTVLEEFHGFDNMYKIELSNGDYQIVNSKHPVYYIRHDWYRKTYTEELDTAPSLMKKDLTRGIHMPKAVIDFPHVDTIIDPYTFGLWIGDGGKDRCTIYNPDVEIIRYLVRKYPETKIRWLKQTKACYAINLHDNKELHDGMKSLGVFGYKFVPDEYLFNDRQTCLEFLAGVIDTDGNLNTNAHGQNYEIVQCVEHLEILKSIKALAHRLGFRCTMSSRVSGPKQKKPGETYYRLRISGKISEIPVKVERKKAVVKENKYRSRLHENYYSFKIEEYGRGEYFGFHIDGNNLFVLDDMTVTHNSFPNLTEVYGNVKDSVKDGDNVFATIYLVGTAGDDKSDFAGAKALLYEPDNNDLMSFENVWDFPGKGRERFGYFFPAYISRSGCMDKDGNSDVVKALLAILMEHYKAKSTGDMSKYTKRKAELCITPADAMIKVTASVFPVNELNERIRQLETDTHAYDDVYIGDLVDTGGGNIVFRANDDVPIRKWPISDNSTLGALEIYEMPVKGQDGKAMRNRYVIGVDPIDNDQAESTSLYSMFVFDMMTERIVAEYTGRKPLANDNYKLTYNAAVFYNAVVMYEANKKMIYAYFAKKNAIWMLAETPQYLRDRQLVKYSNIGSAKYGVSVNAAINKTADEQIETWLLTERPVDVRGEDGEMHQVMMANLYFIRCKALLDEMVNYEPELRKKNVDRIRALSQCMLYREQFIILYGGSIPESTQKDVSDDEFFDRDWKARKMFT